MANDAAIRAGLVTRLETIAGLTATPFLPKRINAPAAAVQRRQTRYDATMADGSDDWEYVITVFVAWNESEIAQTAMSNYLARTGATSIKAAIEAEDTLGGVVDFTRVREAGEEQIRTAGEIEYLAVDFILDITA